MPRERPAVQWSEDALADINEMVDFISQYNPSAAQSLVEAVLQNIERLPRFPRTTEPDASVSDAFFLSCSSTRTCSVEV